MLKINHDFMTLIVSIFTIIAAVSSVIYTIITFRTLKEIKAQRETTYRPELIVDESVFYIYSSKEDEFSFPIKYTYEGKEVSYNRDKSLQYSNSFGLKLYNIGLATAKNIRIKFSIDIEKIIALITNSSINVAEDKKINVIHSAQQIAFEPCNKDITYRSTHMIKSQYIRELNHLLPVNIESNPFIISFPTYILEFNSLLMYNSWNRNNGDNDLITLPTISLAIQYNDIGNKIHEKIIEVSIELLTASCKESRGIIKTVEKNSF